MPGPAIPFQGGIGFSDSVGGGSSLTFTHDIITYSAGNFLQNTPTIAVAIAKNNSSSATVVRAQVTLADATVLTGFHAASIGLQSASFANGEFDLWLFVDSRLAIGGTVQILNHVSSALFGATEAGAAYCAAFDIDLPPGATTDLLNVFQAGPVSGSVNPLVITVTEDPNPLILIAGLGKDLAPHSLLFLVGQPDDFGWSFVGSQQSNGATAALGFAYPLSPPRLTAWWGSDSSGNWATSVWRIGTLGNIRRHGGWAAVIG